MRADGVVDDERSKVWQYDAPCKSCNVRKMVVEQ